MRERVLPTGRASPRRVSVYDRDWEYAKRVGDGCASRGFRRMANYAHLFRHDLANIANAVGLLAQLAEHKGDIETRDSLQQVSKQLASIVQRAQAGNG